MFEGISVAVVTPFRNEQIDEPALRRVVRHLLEQGLQGVVATGSTGEGSALTDAERDRVWRICVEECAGRAFVLAGTGAGSTTATLAATRRAAQAGVDGALVVTPPYAKPSQAGLRQHFEAVAEDGGLPVVLYNVPGRAAVNLLPDTVSALARHPGIVAIKEASGSLDQATEILLGSDITLLSGDDTLALGHFAVGATGLVSVAGHLVGAELVRMHSLVREGGVTEASAIHRRIYPLVRALFMESNPAPVKAALAELGLIQNELRLPLTPVGEGTTERLRATMSGAGVASL